MSSNVMEHSSSSKVTVEYHDPSGVFPLIARELANRLPLRNLNWQSHARPLRQIKHLHVEFVPDAETESILRPPPANRPDPENPTSLDILRSGADGQKGHSKHRRHQIPGLKTTPYLKLYILRCDDKNWYKQEERQKLKAWVRDVVPGDSKQEQHDAFQWLIVHVVIPDTIAASEPRWRESTRDPDELKERSKGTNAKWPGKPPKTVFDRLRSDFNDGKAEGGHIAQIRLSKSQVSIDLLPVPALARTLEETSDEREKSWNDLMTKIRTSILNSFDARVRQYEEDITEQEARQTLPGWNFCTFFIHKEGLARALESVGLLEDALTIYDELGLGLETIIVEMAAGRAPQTATSFPPTGLEIIKRILGPNTNEATKSAAHSSRRLFDKDYRHDIVRSAVSMFDFFCYLFERQTALILRLAGRSTSSESESGVRESGEDLVMLAEICWRGLSFIHNAARTLKQDLSDSDKDLSLSDLHALVTSWTFSAADFVLERTHSTHLDLTDAGIKSPGKLANGHVDGPRRADFGFSMGADAHPARTSSLPGKKGLPKASEVKSVASNSSAGRISEDGLFSPPSSSGGDEIRPEVPGLAELGAYRAELVILKRKMLEELASTKGWYAGWASLSATNCAMRSRQAQTSDVLPSNGTHSITSGTDYIGTDAAASLETNESFDNLFESLTETAIRHYLSATHSKSAEKLMGDLAILKYQEHDYESAATFFEHASPLYQSSGWSYLDAKVIALRADCLERLGRHRDSLLSASSLIAQTAQKQRQKRDSNVSPGVSPLVDDDGALSDWSMERLIKGSEQLKDTLELPLLDFFADLHVGHEISHLDNEDGFAHRFQVRRLFSNAITLDRVSVRLVSATDPSQEIYMRGLRDMTLTEALIDLEVRSNTTTFGSYLLDRIELHAKKIVFAHDLAPKPKATPFALAQASEPNNAIEETRPYLLLYPVHGALNAEIDTANTLALHKARQVAVSLDSGWNDIISINIKLKPNSAGLRLHTTEIKLQGIELRQDSSFRTGIIQLGAFPRNSKALVLVRYSLEQSKSELMVKAEIDYRTTAGEFCFLTDARLPTQLPIDVEVNDIFQEKALYSKFAIRAVEGSPLLLNQAELVGTKAYEVEAPPVALTPTLIMPGQSTDLSFIIRRQKGGSNLTKTDTTMELALNCVSAIDAVRHTLQNAFLAKLLESEFSKYRRLLLPVMVRRFQRAFDNEEYEVAMLLGDIKTPSFAELGWFEVIDTLPAVNQRPLSDWLMKWHIEHQRVAIDTANLPAIANKQFAIAAEVPALDYVFTISFEPKFGQTSDALVSVGQPLELRLTIATSQRWARSEQNKDKQHAFVYDMQISEDIWMIGGKRRARFSVKPDTGDYVTDVILIPLKAGLHSLPHIDVQLVSLGNEGTDGGQTQSLPSYETSVTYAGHFFHVVHDRRRTEHHVIEEDET